MKLLSVLLVLALLPATLALVPGDPNFRGCVISNDAGTFDDSDCDRVPDFVDNCPIIPNPAQSDIDMNGAGDLCDLVIDEITVEPEAPMQGRSTLVRVGIFNNRQYPMRNLVAKVEVPSLGLSASEQLRTINPGERIVRELVMKIPDCAPLKYTDFVAFVEYPFAPSQKEVFSGAVKIPIASSGLCGDAEELTVVDIIELQDVLPDQPAVYPFTITNNWPESKAYVLTVQGHEHWGVAEISTGSVVVLPPGGSREGVISVWGYEGQEGMHSFSFTINARDDAKTVILQADVKKPISQTPVRPGNQLLIGILTFLGILVLIAIVASFMHTKHKQTIKKKAKK